MGLPVGGQVEQSGVENLPRSSATVSLIVRDG
jgi:hypothetical protein